jgi:hypothetical protein
VLGVVAREVLGVGFGPDVRDRVSDSAELGERQRERQEQAGDKAAGQVPTTVHAAENTSSASAGESRMDDWRPGCLR